MKKILLFVIGLLCIIPISGKAVKLTNNYTNLKDTAKAIGLTLNKKGYDEKSDNVEVILFYGAGCPHCHDFIKYLNDLVVKYPHVTLRAYEVWEDSSNAQLMQDVGAEIGEEVRGVPYIIIGKKTYMGFGSSMEKEVEDTIKTIYETPVAKREAYFTTIKTTSKDTKTTTSVASDSKKDSTTTTTTTTAYRALEENNTIKEEKKEEPEEKKESLLSKYKFFFIGAWVIVIAGFAFIIIKGKNN